MSYTAEYAVYEARDLKVIAEVEYDIEEASGDGWNEPREEAHAYVISATLKQVTIKERWGRLTTGAVVKRDPEITVTQLGEAPEWVLNIVRNDEDWLSDLLFDDGPDADDWRDRLNAERLMEAR